MEVSRPIDVQQLGVGKDVHAGCDHGPVRRVVGDHVQLVTAESGEANDEPAGCINIDVVVVEDISASAGLQDRKLGERLGAAGPVDGGHDQEDVGDSGAQVMCQPCQAR